MSASHMGARIMYCGHDGWFVADIFEVAGANVVRANGPVTAKKLVRGRNGDATHHLSDFPSAGFWSAQLGVFVVPAAQVKKLKVSGHSTAGRKGRR